MEVTLLIVGVLDKRSLAHFLDLDSRASVPIHTLPGVTITSRSLPVPVIAFGPSVARSADLSTRTFWTFSLANIRDKKTLTVS